MKSLKSKIKNIKGITLISLVVTIIVLIILAGVTLNMLLGENGIISRAKTAKEQNDKATATETINLKITNVQMSKYAEEQRMPTLKELADNFCEDNDFQYVQETSEVASLTKITNNNPTSIFTKLKAYPYEFEINSSLQLASIDGVKVASNNDGYSITLTQSQYNSILERLTALENNSSSSANNNYSTDEQVVGTWTDGKTIYQKTLVAIDFPQDIVDKTPKIVEYSLNANIDTVVSISGIRYNPNNEKSISPINYTWISGENVYYTNASISDNKLSISSNRSSLSDYKANVTVQYTKTTDTGTN